MRFAIVPACGLSTRMGRPKLALPLGGQTVIERIVAALREGGADCVLVVVGPHVPELIPLASSAGAEVLSLTESTPDMRATVECGLKCFEERYAPAADDWWFLAPADFPAFSAESVRELIAAGDSSCSVVVPVYNSRRGHPVMLRWWHVAGIRALTPSEGINVYLRRFASETREVPVSDPGVLADLDTPQEYARHVNAEQNPAL